MIFKDSVGAVVILAVCWISFGSSDGFGLDVHHRYSDTVKDFLGVEGLPEKDSFDYFAAIAHRDHLSKSRRLASSPFLTFLPGNQTLRLDFLHYSLVSVGNPSVLFLVALDTKDSLFWLPCESCVNCARTWNTTGTSLNLNIYSPTKSSTSSILPCNSTLCDRSRTCSLTRNACAYQQVYSNTTSSTGILVEDVVSFAADNQTQAQTQIPVINVPVTLGCGIIQTGALVNATINGVMGLGLDKISVPSFLASKGLAPDSFSMCFREDGLGRIEFGDKGTPQQKTTPFNLQSLNSSYNVSVTQIAVGGNATNVAFTALVDTITSFTYFTDPAYSFITKNFDSQVKEPRYQPARKFFFEYCYSLGALQETPSFTPNTSFTFKGGDQFYANPIIMLQQQGGNIYCLAIVKSLDINVLGQNFWTGYRIIFDREDMLLGWSQSNCYDASSGSNNGSDAPPPSVSDPAAPPRSRNRTSSSPPPPPPPGNGVTSTTNGLFMIIVSMIFIILSS